MKKPAVSSDEDEEEIEAGLLRLLGEERVVVFDAGYLALCGILTYSPIGQLNSSYFTKVCDFP